MNIKRRVFQVVLHFCQVVHSLHISRFMEKKQQLALHKQVIFIGATSGGLITLRGVLVIQSCFCFTLRAMSISSLGGEIQEFIFFLKIQLLYLLNCFSYFFLVVCLLFACVFLSSFFCLFCVSYELGWCLVIV